MREQDNTAAQPFLTRSRLLQLGAAAVGFVVFLVAVMLFMNAVGIPRLQALIEEAGPLAPAAYIVLKSVTYVFAPLTSGPIQVFAGTLFGSVWHGVLYTLIGEVIGGSISFMIARRFGRPVVARLVGKEGMSQVDQFYTRRLGGWLPLVIARLALFSFWDFLSYAAGLAPVQYRTYLWVSIVCGFFPTFLFVWLGENVVGDSIAALAVAIVVLLVLTLVPLLLMRPINRLLENLSKRPGP
jgi:uncharacterized membrane protein YdjX (TVP38/TMEM64 family)